MTVRLKGIAIELAASQPANLPVQGSGTFNLAGEPEAGPDVRGVPAFCRVKANARPVPGSNIRFEVWLPLSGWNGRLHGAGTGGYAGYIDYPTLGRAIQGGQVGVSTDTGHRGGPFDSAWANGHPERVRDYGWRSIHVSTEAAKALTQAFYGRRPDFSYFVGCSGGGRQGLMEASRFPADYDGIVVGAPAADFAGLVLNGVHTYQVQMPDGAAIRPEQGQLLQSEATRQCDALDGQQDGLVEDPRQCKLDVAKLGCDQSTSAQCFSPPQIDALRRIYAGPRNSAGRQLSPPLLASGAEGGIADPNRGWISAGWESFVLRNQGQRINFNRLIEGFLLDLSNPPIATLEKFDFDRDPVRLRAVAQANINPSPNLSRFFARGGKMILWHGWGDAAIAPQIMLDYHDAMLRTSGRAAAASSRLFMVPGMQHCSGGPGPTIFGGLGPDPSESADRSMIVALQEWVEGRRAAPEAFVARRATAPGAGGPQSSERQRLLCPWPKKAVLRAGADPDHAASYSCVPRGST